MTNAAGQRQRSGASIKSRALAACVIVMALAAALLCAVPAARESAMLLCNRLFDASEAANQYVYKRLPVSDGAAAGPACVLLAIGGAGLAGAAFLCSGGWLPLALAAALAGGQAYFGLSLPAAGNVLLFGLLAACIVKKRAGWRAAAVFAACAAAIALATGALMPGSSAAVENASECVRDWLGTAFETQQGEADGQRPEWIGARHENRRDLSEGAGAAGTDETYRLIAVEEQQIARPHWIDYLRIALMCLLIPVLLVGPFIPFVWINRQQQRIALNRACIDSGECAAAIDGIFALTIGYLDACGIGDRNELHKRRLDRAGGALPEEYRANYRACADIWQEAVYSGHEMTDTQKEQLIALLEQTERLLYDGSGWRNRFRLKYICCLHE